MSVLEFIRRTSLIRIRTEYLFMRPSTRYVGAQKIVDYTNAALMCGEKGTTSRVFATKKEAFASPAKSKDEIAMRHDSEGFVLQYR